MKKQLKYYLHNGYSRGEVEEHIDWQMKGEELPVEVKEKLAEELYNYFYEVGFTVEFDENGKISDVKQIRKG